LVASDYSGAHRNSDYLVYAFLVADADASRGWPPIRTAVRAEYLPDGRRMSFKQLNDAQRQRALVPFLDAANSLSGVCAAVVIHKDLERMSTGRNSLEVWRSLHGIMGNWSPRAFEAMARVVHFYCLFIAGFSKPFQHVTWITDQDEIVANDDRLTDVMHLASKMVGLYVNHPLGEFAMNSTEIDSGDRAFEDFVAIPDLVAGTFAELVTLWSREPGWRNGGDLYLAADRLTTKANVISAWFCSASSNLKRSVILIDRYDDQSYVVQQMDVCR
jgi:hypothetical protein